MAVKINNPVNTQEFEKADGFGRERGAMAKLEEAAHGKTERVVEC